MAKYKCDVGDVRAPGGSRKDVILEATAPKDSGKIYEELKKDYILKHGGQPHNLSIKSGPL